MRLCVLQFGFMITLFFSIINNYSVTVYSEELLSIDNPKAYIDSSKTIMGGGKWLGLHTSGVYTNKYDLGLGFGARMSQRFFCSSLRSTATLHFWGASTDSTDISVAGIEETISYYIPLHTHLSGYLGFVFGYNYSNRKTIEYCINSFETMEKINHTFETFITLEIDYELPKYRSVFIQCKSGITGISKEIHILVGLNFLPRKIDLEENSKSHQ